MLIQVQQNIKNVDHGGGLAYIYMFICMLDIRISHTHTYRERERYIYILIAVTHEPINQVDNCSSRCHITCQLINWATAIKVCIYVYI